ncbi:MAG: hypothetical protein JNL83_12000 [Myxococcales bacterium]|nr:hypothetical protein [Myxococcales bacterium]
MELAEPARRQLLLDERILADGSVSRTRASLSGDGHKVHIEDDDGTAGVLSVPALDRVMTRYGRALDESVERSLAGDALDLPGGYRLRRLRYHAIVDAEGRDYLVWERPGAEPLAAIATMVTAALRYLVLRLSGDPPQESESDGT